MLENVLAVFQQFQELTTIITTQHVEHPSVISVHGVKKKKKIKRAVYGFAQLCCTLFTHPGQAS